MKSKDLDLLADRGRNAMNDEVTTEALRSAQELCAYLWNNTDANNPEAGNVELVAHSDEHAAQLAALLNDARTRVDAALHGLEIQQADVGKTNQSAGAEAKERWDGKRSAPSASRLATPD